MYLKARGCLPPPTQERHPYRVHVSGLAKGAVKRPDGQQSYDEEYQLGDFFHFRGCNVTWVSLLVDKRSSRSRGFAFVDFDDEESFRKASALDGEERPDGLHMDEKNGCILRVSPAKPSEDAIRDKHLELSKERDKTDGLEKDLRLYAARINEKMQQIQTQRERQMALHVNTKVEDELENQHARQQQITKLLSELQAMEKSLTQELNAEKERTEALEELHANVRCYETAEHLEQVSHGVQKSNRQPAMPHIAPEAEKLHRSVSNRSASATPAPMESSPEVSRGRSWRARREDNTEAMHRAASVGHGDISRNILDTKIQALERASSVEQRKAATLEKGRQGDLDRQHSKWGDMEDDDASDGFGEATFIWGKGGGRKDALIRNLPPLPEDELKAGLQEELTRLWEAMHRPEAPKIEAVAVRGQSGGYAQRVAGVEATIMFGDPYDAWLLVERCGASDWSSAATPSLHGRLLQIEWPPTAVPDYRKLAFRADTDASSELSYQTIGTAVSRSSAIATRSAAAHRAGSGGAREREVADEGGKGHVPLQNRTVILAGIPTDLKIYDVQNEVLRLLQRLYQRNNYVFNPQVHLHKGAQGLEAGLEVRAPSSRQDENGGTVKLRFRNYADALWLVEQASGLKIASSKLRASWAQPRDAAKEKGGGASSGAATGGSFSRSPAKGEGKAYSSGPSAARRGEESAWPMSKAIRDASATLGGQGKGDAWHYPSKGDAKGNGRASGADRRFAR